MSFYKGMKEICNVSPLLYGVVLYGSASFSERFLPLLYNIIGRRERVLATSRCAADTMPQSTPFNRRWNYGPFALHNYNTKGNNIMSSSKSIKWDESQSPQWRYLLSQESRARKGLLRKKKSIEEITGEGEIKRNKQSVRASHKKMRKEDRTPPSSSSSKEDLGLTKKGKKIVYSASPGGRGHERYTPPPPPCQHYEEDSPVVVVIEERNE